MHVHLVLSFPMQDQGYFWDGPELFVRKLVEIDFICFNFWLSPIHKLFKFDVNFAVRRLLRILGPIIFSKRPMKLQNGPSKS